jgi:hypothetical protein
MEKGCFNSTNDASNADRPTSSTTTTQSLLIVDEGGKPLFSTLGSPTESAQLAGLLQATRGSMVSHPTLKSLGDIRRLRYGRRTATILTVESITLVALSSGQDIMAERFLEYVYAKLIFALTSQIHVLVRQDHEIDLEAILLRMDARHMAREDSPHKALPLPRFRPITLVTAGVQMFGPLSTDYRRCASSILKSLGDSVPNTVYGLLCIGHELISIVQTSHGQHQIQSLPDLDLLLACIEEQDARSKDLWLPICLPCICSNGFLHCFAHQFDPKTKLTLALVSSDGSTAQFQRFRNVALRMIDLLGPSHVAVDGEDEDYELVSYPTTSSNDSINLLESIHAAQINNESLKHRLRGTDCLHFVARRLFAIHGTRNNRRRQQKAPHATTLLQAISSGGDDECTLWERYARLGLLLRANMPDPAAALSSTQLDFLPSELSFAYEHHSDYLVFGIGNAHTEL